MRKLMWFTIGFSASCAIGAYLVSGVWLLLLAACCLIAIAALIYARVFNRRTVFALLGCLMGLVWYWCFDLIYLAPVRNMDNSATILSIEVSDYSCDTQFGITAEGRTKINGKTYSVQFYYNESVTLSPGDRVEGGFRLRYTDGGAEESTYHRGKGIFLLCYPKGEITVLTQQEKSTGNFVAVWRQKILSRLETIFPNDTAPFTQAMILGKKDALDFETKWAMKTSGIYHIVAVSGLHVSILFGMVCLLCKRQRSLLVLIGLPALFLFAALAGFSPSIVRACIMQGLMVLALLVNKEYDPPTALAAAVLTLLIWNPLSITSVSLQLSAGCVAGILLFAEPIHNYLLSTRLGPAKGKGLRARLVRWSVSSVSVTLGAMALTTPLCAVYFGSVSVLGILTNLLLLWLVGIILYAIVAACALSFFWQPLGIGVGWVFSWPIRFIKWVTVMISRLPVSAVYTSSIYIVFWLVFCYVLLVVFLKSKKKHPVVFGICILVGLVSAVACSWLEPRLDDFRLTAVDVGQGQCLLLQNEGRYYMVDCGGDDADTAAEEGIKLLLSQGVFRLDGLILTHYDVDHAGGVQQLLSIVPADRLYLPIFDGDNSLRDELAQRFGDRVHWVDRDLILEESGITIYPSVNTEDDNESSLCILFQPEGYDMLITGDRSADGERELMEHTDLPDLEILVAGHHGSKYSTSWELLNETRPEIVIISVGAENRYGHPTEEALERLGLFGCNIYRTDLEGTIIFRG